MEDFNETVIFKYYASVTDHPSGNLAIQPDPLS